MTHLKVCRVAWLDLARWKPPGREACADAAPAHIMCCILNPMAQTVHNHMIASNHTCDAGRASSTAQCRSADSVGGARSGVVRGHSRDVAGRVVDGETVLGHGGVISIIAHQIHLHTQSICSGPQALAAKLHRLNGARYRTTFPLGGYESQSHHIMSHATCKQTGCEGL